MRNTLSYLCLALSLYLAYRWFLTRPSMDEVIYLFGTNFLCYLAGQFAR